MSDDEILKLASNVLPKIKSRLGIDETNTVNDTTLTDIIYDTIQELINCGVPSEIVISSSSLGAIAKGVKDQWNYNGGSSSELSQDFYNKVERLRRKHV